MIRRLSIALFAAAALGGCATYGYSGGDDGDYYYGSPGTDYYYGAPYGSVGYYGGYGSIRYGYGYGGYGYGYGPGYGYYYPPYYYYPRPEPRPPRPPVPPRWPDGLAPDNGVRYPSRGYEGAYGRPQVTSPGAPQAGGRGGVVSRGYEEGTRTPPPQARPFESRGRPGDGAMPPRQMAPQQPMQQRPFESRGRPSEMRSAPAPRQEMRSAPAPRQEMRSAPMRSASPNRDDRRSREP